jgi:KipI family sensor histidine kinase inhibitor
MIIKAGDDISPGTNRLVRMLLRRIEKEGMAGITGYIPSYNELMVCYDPSIIGYRELSDRLRSLGNSLDDMELPASSLIRVPVLYGGDAGPDLQEVASIHRMSIQEVIDLHSAPDYLVYMLGFTPGFCYLGGMDDNIATPRKATPRVKIPAGSVGIAGNQTGIYPVDSPGGWQLIGKTPFRLFDPDREPVFLFQPGDLLRFVPVTEEEFREINQEIQLGKFEKNHYIIT